MQRQASQGWEELQAVVREWDPGIRDFRGGAVSAGDKAQGVATGVGRLKGQQEKVLGECSSDARGSGVVHGSTQPFLLGLERNN